MLHKHALFFVTVPFLSISALLVTTSVRAEAPDCSDSPDCIVVTCSNCGPWGAIHLLFSTGGTDGAAGGGSGLGELRAEVTTAPDPDIDGVTIGVLKRHKVDLDADGAGDLIMDAPFLMNGPDSDGDGIPDLWDSMKAEGRAWIY